MKELHEIENRTRDDFSVTKDHHLLPGKDAIMLEMKRVAALEAEKIMERFCNSVKVNVDREVDVPFTFSSDLAGDLIKSKLKAWAKMQEYKIYFLNGIIRLRPPVGKYRNRTVQKIGRFVNSALKQWKFLIVVCAVPISLTTAYMWPTSPTTYTVKSVEFQQSASVAGKIYMQDIVTAEDSQGVNHKFTTDVGEYMIGDVLRYTE